jgi:hypothetical protein
MAYGLTLVFENVNEDQYWAVNEKLGIGRNGKGDYPKGLVSHIGGPTATGWAVMEVWESKAAQEEFMASRLGAALGAAGVPAPAQLIETEAVNSQQF